jgi:hypothetical protein
MTFMRRPWSWMIWSSRASPPVPGVVFRQQLRRMGDGAQRIAYFVCDAGGEPRQRFHLELRGLLFEHRRILQKHQHAGVFAPLTNRQKARNQRISGVRVKDRLGAAGSRPGPPLPDLHVEFGRNVRQGDPRQIFDSPRNAEEVARGLVHHVYPAIGVADQDPRVHPGNDELVELRQVGQVHAALLGQRLGSAQAARDQVREPGGGEQADPEHAHLGVAVGIPAARRPFAFGQKGPIHLKADGNGGERGKQDGEARTEREARAGDGYQQQQADTAFQSMAGMHEQGEQDDIGERQQGGLGSEIRPTTPQGDERERGYAGIHETGVQEQAWTRSGKRCNSQVREHQSGRGGGDQQTIEVERAQQFPVFCDEPRLAFFYGDYGTKKPAVHERLPGCMAGATLPRGDRSSLSGTTGVGMGTTAVMFAARCDGFAPGHECPAVVTA